MIPVRGSDGSTGDPSTLFETAEVNVDVGVVVNVEFVGGDGDSNVAGRFEGMVDVNVNAHVGTSADGGADGVSNVDGIGDSVLERNVVVKAVVEVEAPVVEEHVASSAICAGDS